MRVLSRLKAAWLSFLDPDAYWEGVSIRKIADEITIKHGMALLHGDPKMGYVVRVLPHNDQAAIERFVGIPSI